MRKRGIIFLILVLLSSGVVLEAAPPVVPPTSADPGAQLNRDRDLLERLKVEREIREQQNRDESVIEGGEGGTEPPDASETIMIFLKDLQFTESAILTEDELKAIELKYENKELSIKELYSIVNEINDLYAQKGFLVCRAILPEQSIQEGIIKIILVEGRTGDVVIENNQSTSSHYIKNRLPLKSGVVANFNELNDKVQFFNGTNDVQLQIEIKAGSVGGTTDYYIKAYEPQQHVFTLFADNNGYEDNGEWRGGLGYTNRSLLGWRDELNLVGMGSEGSWSGTASYTVPITKKGTRLGFNYSQNRVKTIDGPLEDLEIVGKSNSYGVSLTQPLKVTKKLQMEAFFDWRHQNSQTEILGFDWIDDEISNFSGGLSFTHYWKNAALYHRHGLSAGTWDNIFDERKNYKRYNFMGLYQHSVGKSHLLTVRANAQLTSDDFISSSDQFYIGGLYSVRGYEENLLAADNGISATIEYAVPVGKQHQIFTFLDYGHVWGDNSFYDSSLLGTGIGWRWNYAKGGTFLFTAGIPLDRTINDQKVDSTQLYFSINQQF